jgi:hypothetical protein
MGNMLEIVAESGDREVRSVYLVIPDYTKDAPEFLIVIHDAYGLNWEVDLISNGKYGRMDQWHCPWRCARKAEEEAFGI